MDGARQDEERRVPQREVGAPHLQAYKPLTDVRRPQEGPDHAAGTEEACDVPQRRAWQEGLSSRALPSDLPLWEAFLQHGRYQEPGSQAQEAHQPHQEQEGLHARQTGQTEVRAPGREGAAAGRGQALEGRGGGGQACTATRHAKARSSGGRGVGCIDRFLLNHEVFRHL